MAPAPRKGTTHQRDGGAHNGSSRGLLRRSSGRVTSKLPLEQFLAYDPRVHDPERAGRQVGLVDVQAEELAELELVLR
jgi:hypothetical protein